MPNDSARVDIDFALKRKVLQTIIANNFECEIIQIVV